MQNLENPEFTDLEEQRIIASVQAKIQQLKRNKTESKEYKNTIMSIQKTKTEIQQILIKLLKSIDNLSTSKKTEHHIRLIQELLNNAITTLHQEIACADKAILKNRLLNSASNSAIKMLKKILTIYNILQQPNEQQFIPEINIEKGYESFFNSVFRTIKTQETFMELENTHKHIMLDNINKTDIDILLLMKTFFDISNVNKKKMSEKNLFMLKLNTRKSLNNAIKLLHSADKTEDIKNLIYLINLATEISNSHASVFVIQTAKNLARQLNLDEIIKHLNASLITENEVIEKQLQLGSIHALQINIMAAKRSIAETSKLIYKQNSNCEFKRENQSALDSKKELIKLLKSPINFLSKILKKESLHKKPQQTVKHNLKDLSKIPPHSANNLRI